MQLGSDGRTCVKACRGVGRFSISIKSSQTLCVADAIFAGVGVGGVPVQASYSLPQEHAHMTPRETSAGLHLALKNAYTHVVCQGKQPASCFDAPSLCECARRACTRKGTGTRRPSCP